MFKLRVFQKSLKMDFKSEVERSDQLFDDLFNDNVPYLNASFCGENLYFAMTYDNIVVGTLCLSYYEKGWGDPLFKWAILNIGVDQDFRNKGIASTLIKEMFSFCEKNNISKIKASSYSDDGQRYIAHIFKRESEKYKDITFKEKK